MKKLIFLLLVVVALPLQAQEWSFAPKIGLNLANITNADGKMKPGLNIGVTAECRITDVFAIEPGLFYSMQGLKMEKIDGVTPKFKNDYLNIPILAKAYVKDGFNLFAGPQLGFKVSEKVSGSQSGVSANIDTDLLKTFDFSLVLGMGYQFDMGLLVSLNYNIGLTNVLKEEGKILGETTYTGKDETSRNGVLQLTVGWRF